MSIKFSEKIHAILDRREKACLCSAASFSKDGRRRHPDDRSDSDYRQAFAVDVDRILHSRAYTRYIDKTQVFYMVENDHITHRVLHVQLVSKISRTIGRILKLNEDLIEAIALGHDIGHAPFGHEGETYLSELCLYNGIGYFSHNVQSIQFLDYVERNGKGLNLCIQTLDGILCHDGETHSLEVRPSFKKSFEKIDRNIKLKKEDSNIKVSPMTLEGCVVRMADAISYVGRDIEDAILLDVIDRSDIPRECVKTLGNTNGSIVYRLVTDIIENSFQKNYISFSPHVSEALRKLKAFNLEHIYLNQEIKRYSSEIKRLFSILFERYLKDIERANKNSPVFKQFLNDKAPVYTEKHKPAEIVRDFIAGMTDKYFLRQCPDTRFKNR